MFSFNVRNRRVYLSPSRIIGFETNLAGDETSIYVDGLSPFVSDENIETLVGRLTDALAISRKS